MSEVAERPWAEIASRAQAAKAADAYLDAAVVNLVFPGPIPTRWTGIRLSPSNSVDAMLMLVAEIDPLAAVKTWSPHYVAAVRISGHWGEAAGETLPLSLLAAFALAMDETTPPLPAPLASEGGR